MKKLRLLALAVIVASAIASVATSASAANLCPSPTWQCWYTNIDGCCRVFRSAPDYYCPEFCD
jgi:hypothetical protein